MNGDDPVKKAKGFAEDQLGLGKKGEDNDTAEQKSNGSTEGLNQKRQSKIEELKDRFGEDKVEEVVNEFMTGAEASATIGEPRETDRGMAVDTVSGTTEVYEDEGEVMVEDPFGNVVSAGESGEISVEDVAEEQQYGYQDVAGSIESALEKRTEEKADEKELEGIEEETGETTIEVGQEPSYINAARKIGEMEKLQNDLNLSWDEIRGMPEEELANRIEELD